MSGLNKIKKLIKEHVNVDVDEIDTSVVEGEVIGVDNFGKSFKITDNKVYVDLFKLYEKLEYGA